MPADDPADMTGADVLAAVTAAFRDVFDNPTLTLSPAMRGADIAEWDSLRMVLLLTTLEERLDIRFTTPEMDAIQCVGDLVGIVARKLAGT